jgi:hypothetical protein
MKNGKDTMSTIKLKDEDGNVVEVKKESCYPPDENGEIMVCLHKFSYFRGRETDEPVNYFPNPTKMS